MYLLPSQVSINVDHVFSVESVDSKRKFIMAAHGRSMHLFGDVSIFAAENVDANHYCYTCERSHPVPTCVDFLGSGPSCKSISSQFTQRDEYKSCFLFQPAVPVNTVGEAFLFATSLLHNK